MWRIERDADGCGADLVLMPGVDSVAPIRVSGFTYVARRQRSAFRGGSLRLVGFRQRYDHVAVALAAAHGLRRFMRGSDRFWEK
jgi:hypothetical protein